MHCVILRIMRIYYVCMYVCTVDTKSMNDGNELMCPLAIYAQYKHSTHTQATSVTHRFDITHIFTSVPTDTEYTEYAHFCSYPQVAWHGWIWI